MRSDKITANVHLDAERWSEQWFGLNCEKLSQRLLEIGGDIKRGEPKPVTRTRLDHWCLARRTVPCLIGIATGHPTIADGAPFFSSELYFMDANRSSARSFSRWYELGDQVEPSYWEQLYPRQI